MKDGAYKIAAGILLSRISGLLREHVFAHYFGNSLAGDAFRAAMRIPNFLQNLLGEGVLSASFIPVYAQTLAKGEKELAQKLAGAILSWLCAFVAVLVVLGIAFSPLLIGLIAPGFSGDRRELTVELVRIFFLGTGTLVISAWCLGVLNSHRRFFLPYVAPAACNMVMMIALIWHPHYLQGEPTLHASLAVRGAWGFALGTALQLAVQVPLTFSLLGRFRPGFGASLPAVRSVLWNFWPVAVARGVVQLSAYIDTMLASWLPLGSLSALSFAQTIYILPVSLFGMSISASQLPEMSSHHGDTESIHRALREQLNFGLERIAFYVIPSVAAFIILGKTIVGAIYHGGQFQEPAVQTVWWLLSGYSFGLLAVTLSRLYSSTFYALGDTRSPFRIAVVRVLISTALGCFGAFVIPQALQLDSHWGTFGLTLAAALGSTSEYWLLRRKMTRLIGRSQLRARYLGGLWLAAALSAALAFGLQKFFGLSYRWQVLSVIAPFGASYIAFCYCIGVGEARKIVFRIVNWPL